MAQRSKQYEEVIPDDDLPRRVVEHFSVSMRTLRASDERRLDASFYNPRVAEALAALYRSGMELKSLSEVTRRIFIPPRFKRVYVESGYGVPFLQGSHVVHFEPADIKFLSRAVHKGLDRWIIEAGWVLVTCSGTIGRVTIASPSWDRWAASQHILRIIPDPDGPCPAGYISAFLSSEIGQAQLTSRIYGAVVDEITEGQAQSVLIPVPTTKKEKDVVAQIHADAWRSIVLKDEAVGFSQKAVGDLASIIPDLRKENAEDKDDAEVARRRLRQLNEHPEMVISGEALEAKMKQWQS